MAVVPALAQVYALVDPRTFRPRYIGVCRRPLVDRYRQHLYTANCASAKHPVYRWIRELFGLGLKPGLVVIDEAHDYTNGDGSLLLQSRHADWEGVYIRRFMRRFPDLLNSPSVLRRPQSPNPLGKDIQRRFVNPKALRKPKR